MATAVALLKKRLALLTSAVFMDPEGRLVVRDMTYNTKAFRLIGIYAPFTRRQQGNFYRHLENISEASKN